MNKLDTTPHTFVLSPVSHADPEPVRRLIVLFPASEIETPDLEHRIWELARSSHLNVLFLSLADDFEEETLLRRKLVTMAAMIKDPNVATDILIEHGSDWVGLVSKVWAKGDMVACYAGQRVGLMRKSLDQILKSNLETTVYILSNYQQDKNLSSKFLSQLLFWLGSVVIIGSFLWGEVKIVQLPPDWTHTALIYVCIFVEVALIYLWNSLFT